MEWIIVGLGNPGEEYDATRHNIGKEAVLSFASGVGISLSRDGILDASLGKGVMDGHELALMIPETYMNLSGGPVAKALTRFATPLPRLCVVHDDVDLPLGTVRVSVGRGSGGHHGVDSIIASTHGNGFVRVRIGILPAHGRKPEHGEAFERFVLGRFPASEREAVTEAVDFTCKVIRDIIIHGAEQSMNIHNPRQAS
jgi:peptidyl-tRNA hydrolase, PTH1 family